MPREVEIKFRVADVRGLQRLLRKLHFRQVTPRAHEMNTLYDRNGALRRRGELLRLRQYGQIWTLTHKAKGKAGRHKIRIETETKVTDGKTLDHVFRAMGFTPSFRYEKFRSEWTDSKGHAVIDETPVGVFAELEGPARWIDRTARALGVAPKDYITQTYAELFLAWKRSHHNAAKEMTFSALHRP